MGESMRSNLPVAVLVTGMLSLLASAGAALAGSNLDALVARLNGAADAGGRRQIMRSLSQAERRQVHAEYRALSLEGKRVFDTALGRKPKPGGKARVPLGTIQYDTHTPFFVPDDTNDVVGNQFNTGFGNPHNITFVSFSQAATGFFTPMRIYDAPVGGMAPVLASTTFFGNAGGAWTLQPPIVNHSGSFLVGLKQTEISSFPMPSVVAIAVDVNNGGQGFHGMNIKLNGSGFVPNATVAGQPYNAILRVSGINLPVELMGFGVQ
jgi:hypothetical protein